MLPWDAPVLAAQAAPHTDLCRLAYVLRHNDRRHVPDWVAWPTGRTHAAGCIPRSDSFRTDPDLPPGIGATPADYDEPDYDQGHVAGDAYFNYAVEPERQSFLMSNMTPQTGASNRGPYRILEMASREWAAASNTGIWTIAGGDLWRAAEDDRQNQGSGSRGELENRCARHSRRRGHHSERAELSRPARMAGFYCAGRRGRTSGRDPDQPAGRHLARCGRARLAGEPRPVDRRPPNRLRRPPLTTSPPSSRRRPGPTPRATKS
jgi:hypothetical protein